MDSWSVWIALASLGLAAHAEWRITRNEQRDAIQWVAEPLVSNGRQVGFIVRNVGKETAQLAIADSEALPNVRLDLHYPNGPIHPNASFEVRFVDEDWRQVHRELPIRWNDARGRGRRGAVALPPRAFAPRQS